MQHCEILSYPNGMLDTFTTFDLQSIMGSFTSYLLYSLIRAPEGLLVWSFITKVTDIIITPTIVGKIYSRLLTSILILGKVKNSHLGLIKGYQLQS